MAQAGVVAQDGHARYTFRLRVSSTARTALVAEWDRCRWVWNECVAKSRAVHLHNKATGENQTCGPAQLDRMLTEARARTPWLREGSSVVQQQVIRDFGRSRGKAHKDIWDRLPMARRAGMPKWKSKREALPTLNYTRRGFRLKDGRLHLAGGIILTVVWSRDLAGEPSSVRVYQDSLGHWYASFVVPAQVQPLPETGRVLGVDWGVKETATTTSDAHDLPHAGHGQKAQKKLTRYDRMMARRKPKKGQPASKGYREAKKLRAKAHKKVARQRADTGRKWAKKVVRDHDAIAVEDFRPKCLARTTMARKAADAAIGATKTALTEMGRKHGRDIRLVHPAHTTMDCGHCDARAKHRSPTASRAWEDPQPLGERTYTCTACGVVSPRDKNSARVMLVRAGLNPAGTDGRRPPGALLQEAA
ncbi:RNA-guided endonuclease InsQ/TnpB family protein [Streptomyces sp. NPDC005263]|uniref:RNA-guided endonuclease InsQ/TnpB family protein n=1 Tax=Streptomyces sp. NPDC005263 TaxID=3364711 RepID=UPI0036881B8D